MTIDALSAAASTPSLTTGRTSARVPKQEMDGDLEFIPNKERWGAPFRRGFFEIGEADYRRIAEAMNAS